MERFRNGHQRMTTTAHKQAHTGRKNTVPDHMKTPTVTIQTGLIWLKLWQNQPVINAIQYTKALKMWQRSHIHTLCVRCVLIIFWIQTGEKGQWHTQWAKSWPGRKLRNGILLTLLYIFHNMHATSQVLAKILNSTSSSSELEDARKTSQNSSTSCLGILESLDKAQKWMSPISSSASVISSAKCSQKLQSNCASSAKQTCSVI